ncbi:MAG TPA: alkyl hydroperoxide reductase subunit F [Arenimonas sp.]|nr:alkyl hydroperoxide reductase subunit F [Arenimonas sp.]
MLDTAIQSQLKDYLEKLQRPVELVASLDDSAKAAEMRALLEAIAPLSDKVGLRFDGDAGLRPSFGIATAGEAARIHFAGIPMGHEFTSLVLALLQTGGHPPKIEPELIERIKTLPGGGNFETFVSLSCHNCPDVVQAFNLIAVLNPGYSHTMIDGAVFPALAEQRQIMAVPCVYRDAEVFGNGRMTLEEIIARLDSSSAARDAGKLSAKGVFDMLIVGGGPAGAAAAVYGARKGIVTGVAAERFGGQLLDTMAIENFISVNETDGPKLAMALEQHVRSYEVDIMSGQKAVELIPGELIEVKLENGASLKSKSVILSTGARWREMNVPGEAEYRNKGVAYCPHCDGPLYKGKRVAVIGGGNSGVEAAIDLAGIVAQVTLIEFDTALRADAVLQKKLFSMPNVTVITNALSTEVHGDGRKVNGLSYRERSTDALKRIDLEGIFVQIGLLPNTDWLKGVVELSNRGEIEIDARGQTSIPGVFAAGDCTTVPYKQIIIATGAGSTAALGAFDHLIRSSAPA